MRKKLEQSLKKKIEFNFFVKNWKYKFKKVPHLSKQQARKI